IPAQPALGNRAGQLPIRFAAQSEEMVMTPEEMRVLYDYNAWANQRQLRAVSKLTTDAFLKPMGSSFGSVRDTLAHIYGAEWVWLERFQGRSPSSLPDVTHFKDVKGLEERWKEFEPRLTDLMHFYRERAVAAGA